MSELRTERPKNNRPKMSNSERAKQFAPFAALGHLGDAFAYIEQQINIGELESIPEAEDFMQDDEQI